MWAIDGFRHRKDVVYSKMQYSHGVATVWERNSVGVCERSLRELAVLETVGVVTLPFASHVVNVIVAGPDMQIQRVDALFNAISGVVLGVGNDIIPRCRIDRQIKTVVVVVHSLAYRIVEYIVLRDSVLGECHRF